MNKCSLKKTKYNTLNPPLDFFDLPGAKRYYLELNGFKNYEAVWYQIYDGKVVLRITNLSGNKVSNMPTTMVFPEYKKVEYPFDESNSYLTREIEIYNKAIDECKKLNGVKE